MHSAHRQRKLGQCPRQTSPAARGCYVQALAGRYGCRFPVNKVDQRGAVFSSFFTMSDTTYDLGHQLLCPAGPIWELELLHLSLGVLVPRATCLRLLPCRACVDEVATCCCSSQMYRPCCVYKSNPCARSPYSMKDLERFRCVWATEEHITEGMIGL